MRSLLRSLFERVGRGRPEVIAVRFADGSTWRNAEGEPAVTIVFRTRAAEARTLLLGYVGFFEAYFDRQVDILGEDAVGRLMRMAYGSAYRYQANPIVTLMRRWREWRDDNRDEAAARANARRHYGLPHAFFALMLGEECLYAEGIWDEGATTLAEAERHRCEAICRTLQLRPGERLVEVGSGWGEMALHAAERHGVEVVNYGLVPEQNAVMAERIRRRGLEGRVTIVEKDHRALRDEPGRYDKYLSVGVYEHAGERWQPAWIESIAAALKPGGMGLISTTSYLSQFSTEYLTLKYVFPGGSVPSLPRALELLDRNGLHVVRVEELGWHYQRTAACWLANVEAHWDEIAALDPRRFDEKFRRIWTWYLHGVIEGFRPAGGGLNLHHILVTKGKGEWSRHGGRERAARADAA